MEDYIDDSREEEYMLLMLFMSMGMTDDQLKIIREMYLKNKECEFLPICLN